MKGIIVADASSLILLTKADLTEMLIRKFKVLIPEHVYRECVNESALKRFLDAKQIQQWVHDRLIEVRKVDLPKSEFTYHTGRGEKEAIALSLEVRDSIFLTDDGNAIKIAKYLGKPFIVSPLLAVDLYRLNEISYEKAKQSIEKLSIFGRYRPDLIADVFIMLGAARKEKERK